MSSKIVLKLRDFWKRNRTKIIIIVLVWSIIAIINYILKNYKPAELPKTTYKPHTAIMDDSEVPEKLQDPIEELIDKYINYCNDKDYESAYYMLSQSCRDSIYPDINDFKKYIDKIFDEKKVYYIQNYSNVDNIYVYSVCIFEDILASGLTGSEVKYYEEKFTVKNNNGNLELAIREYIEENKVQNVYEDDYLKVSIENVVQKYETQMYTVKITNRCEYPIVLADGTESKEILLGLEYENRNIKNLPYKGIVVYPGESKVYKFEFTKFYDENEVTQSLIFNAVRVLRSYSGREELRQSEMDNAIKLYSFLMKL